MATAPLAEWLCLNKVLLLNSKLKMRVIVHTTIAVLLMARTPSFRLVILDSGVERHYSRSSLEYILKVGRIIAAHFLLTMKGISENEKDISNTRSRAVRV